MFVPLRNLLWNTIYRPSGSFPFNTVESNSVDPDESSLYVASQLGWYRVQFSTSKLDRGLNIHVYHCKNGTGCIC